MPTATYHVAARHDINISLKVCLDELKFTAFGRLELEWCERKILLSDWWLEAGAGAM